MKWFALVLVCVCVVALVACKKRGDKAASPDVKESSSGGVEITIKAADMSAENYRKLFNEVAGALYGFQWIGDFTNPSQIDFDKNELYVPQALRAQFGLTGDSISQTVALMTAIENVKKGVEEKRKASVASTLAAQREIHQWFDLGKLSEANQKASRYLIEAGYWMHELYKLQLDKNYEATQTSIYASGDINSIRLFERNAGAFCGRYGDAATCALLPDFSVPSIGAIMWPDDMNEKDFEKIKASSKDPSKDPLLSPFTVVEKDEKGNFKAVPYAKFAPFQQKMEKIASLFEQASEVDGIDPTFAKQLKLQAAAFRSDSDRPYFESDEAWGATKGELELTAGPYESYEDHFGTKAFFEFMLGAEEKEATEVINKFIPVLPTIEQQFASLVGPELYKPRELGVMPPIRVVRVISGLGEVKKSGGPSIAFNLPNIGPMAERGTPKRVIMANHHEAKFPILRAIAEIAIVPEQLNDIDAHSFVFDSTFHEIMHGIGPQRETKVGDSTVALMMDEYYDGLEEAKANVGGVWSAKFLADAGVITPDQLRKIQATYIAGLLRIMRFGAKEAHAQGAALEFSYIFSKGGIEQRGEQFAVNYEKLQDALAALVSDIGKTLLSGDKAAAKVLLEDFPARAPALLEVLAKKFAVAQIPRDVALVYHVNGL